MAVRLNKRSLHKVNEKSIYDMYRTQRCFFVSALSVPLLIQNNISVLRRTDTVEERRGEERRAGTFFCSFIEFRPVTCAKSNFLARKFNPSLAVVWFCYTSLTQGGLLSKLYARVLTEVI